MNIGDFVAALVPWMPAWILGIGLFALIVAAGFLIQSVLVRFLTRFFARRHVQHLELFRRVRRPLRFAIVLFAAATAFPIVPMPPAANDMAHGVLIAATIILIGWIVLVLANALAERTLGRYRMDVADNLLARKAATQIRIVTRAADTLIVILTVAFALMSFPSVRQFGVTLFASAGVAGIVAGLAARPVLENLLAGLQLALTQPIRIDDVLVVQGQWGWVEEINSTYIVMRLWDWRRYVLPISYFLKNPFENWTRTNSQIIGSVYFYLDYTAPVETLRAKATEIVKASKLWNGNVVNVQVSDAKTDTIELRVLVSAADSSIAWDVRCEVREKLLAYIQKEFPSALPQCRSQAIVALDPLPAGDPRGAPRT